MVKTVMRKTAELMLQWRIVSNDNGDETLMSLIMGQVAFCEQKDIEDAMN